MLRWVFKAWANLLCPLSRGRAARDSPLATLNGRGCFGSKCAEPAARPQTTVDHALIRGLGTAATVIRLGLPMSTGGRRCTSATMISHWGSPPLASPPALCTLCLRVFRYSFFYLLSVEQTNNSRLFGCARQQRWQPLATLAARVKTFTALARRRRRRGPPAVAGGRIRLQAGLDARCQCGRLHHRW